MKVLSIGTDRRLFDEDSPVAIRNIFFGKSTESTDIIVFSPSSASRKVKKISDNVTLYPTNSISRWFYIWDAIKIGKEIIKRKKLKRGSSVITCQDPFECGLTGYFLSKQFNFPLHLQIHTDFLSKFFRNSFLQKMRILIAKFLLPKADYIRVVSPRIAESMKKEGIKLKHEARILPVYIDKDISEIGENDENLNRIFSKFKFTILIASRLTEEKKIQDILHVFAKLLKVYSHIGLIIAGEGPLRKKLEIESDYLGLSDNVVFLGWRSDTMKLMSMSNMFLSNSAYEGYGMSIIEAGLAKCPVLSTNVGVAGDILVHNKNSYICPVGDTICLYEGIMTFVDDPHFRRILAQNLASDITKGLLSKEDYARNYISLLEEASKA